MPEPTAGRSAQQAAAALAAQRQGAGFPPVKGFLETSFLDWRGMISSVLFLPGCNFACPYCHNHQLAADSDSLQDLPLDGLLDRLRPFKGWIDGVVVSGGEPTLHAGLPKLLGAVKEMGFGVKLDTNGYRPEVLAYLHRHGLLDMVSMDLKAPLEPMAYRRAAGRKVDVGQVKASLDFLVSSGLPHEFRSTIWPAWHGQAELEAMGQALAGADRWTLQALNPANAWNPQALGEGKPFESGDIARLKTEVAQKFCPRPH